MARTKSDFIVFGLWSVANDDRTHKKKKDEVEKKGRQNRKNRLECVYGVFTRVKWCAPLEK